MTHRDPWPFPPSHDDLREEMGIYPHSRPWTAQQTCDALLKKLAEGRLIGLHEALDHIVALNSQPVKVSPEDIIKHLQDLIFCVERQ